MKSDLNFSRTTIVKLIDALGMPDPDAVGPLGPGGPVMHGWWQWVALNPQPLPPGPPDPQPWRATLLARSVIATAVSHLQIAEAVAGADRMEKSAEAVRSQLREFVDDFCGTRPPRWPLPWPWPTRLDPERLVARDFFLAGAEFQRAADLGTKSPLQPELASAAERLFETGLKRLESGT